MKTALYQTDGVMQVVLSPETEAEKVVLQIVEEGRQVRHYRGSFYECQGGYVRQKHGFDDGYGPFGARDQRDESLIIVLRDKAEPPPPDERDRLLELAWGVIANASGGNWALETPQWQEAASSWRDQWTRLSGGARPDPVRL